jgi:hypothetical protein
MKENQVLKFLETILFKNGYKNHSICFTKNDWLFNQNDTKMKTDYFVCVIIRQGKEEEEIFYGSSEETYYKAVRNVLVKINEKIKTARRVELRAA